MQMIRSNKLLSGFKLAAAVFGASFAVAALGATDPSVSASAATTFAEPVAPVASGPDIPIVNWTAPQYYGMPKGISSSDPAAFGPPGLRHKAVLNVSTFIPITPCRLVDTRGVFSPVYAGGPFTAGETRVYRAAGNCGIPAGSNRLQAVSLAVTTPPTAASGDIEVISNAATLGNTVVMVIQAGQWNSATTVTAVDANGDFKVQLRSTPGNVVIDINGYYASTSTTNTTDFLSITGTYSAGGGMLYVSNLTTDPNSAAVHAQGASTGLYLATPTYAISVYGGGFQVDGAGVNTNTFTFVHQVTAANLCPNTQFTVLQNTQTTGAANQNSLLQVTQTGGVGGTTPPSAGNSQRALPVAANYLNGACNDVAPSLRWFLFTPTAFAVGDRFIVTVFKP